MKTYLQPIVLWLVVIAGLVLALLCNGVLEKLATAACAVPLLVVAMRFRAPAQIIQGQNGAGAGHD